MEDALEHCRKNLGDNVTILYDGFISSSIRKMVEEQGKKTGGPWDCYRAGIFFGWEDERVVVVTTGIDIMELITRARTHLYVIIVERANNRSDDYAKTKKHFKHAAYLGLIEEVQLGGEAVEISQQVDDEGEEENGDEKISCMSGCCTS